MDHARFWALIDDARRAAPGAPAPALERALCALPAEQIAAFDAWFGAYRAALAREDLWAAVYVIRGGCGDDSFDSFRAWLVGRGERVVLAAVRDPESLGDVVGDDEPRDEALLGVAARAHWHVAGRPPGVREPTIVVPGIDGWPPDRLAYGAQWTPELLRERYPRLYARYEAPRARALPGAAHASPVRAPPAEPPDAYSPIYRELRADHLLHAAQDAERARDDRAALALVEQALAYTPRRAAVLFQRARAHARLGDVDAALVDLDRTIELEPRSHAAMLERARLLHARGETAAALDDARRASALGLDAARDWLAAHAPAAATPARVRHAKFGEGRVVAVDGVGDTQKLVVEFADGRRTLLRRFVEVVA